MAAKRIIGGLGILVLALALGLGLSVVGCQMPQTVTAPPSHTFGEPVNTPTLYSFDDAAGQPLYFLSEPEMKWAMQHRPIRPAVTPTPAPTQYPTPSSSSPTSAPGKH